MNQQKEDQQKGDQRIGDQRIGHYEMQVEPFSEDFTGRLAWSMLGNQLLRVAERQAVVGGFGFDAMHGLRHTWVLSRLVIEITSDLPRTGERYCIETWVPKIYRQFSDRHFRITTPDGHHTFGYALSTWALIDLESRAPMSLDDLPDDAFRSALVPERLCPIDGPSRTRLKAGTEPVARHRAAYSDLDINGHVNSIRYITMLMDQLPLQAMEQGIRRVEMAYSAESHAGETLDLYLQEQQPGYYVGAVGREGSQVAKGLFIV